MYVHSAPAMQRQSLRLILHAARHNEIPVPEHRAVRLPAFPSPPNPRPPTTVGRRGLKKSEDRRSLFREEESEKRRKKRLEIPSQTVMTLSMNWSEALPGKCWKLSLHGHSDVHNRATVESLWLSAQIAHETGGELVERVGS